MVNYWKNNTLYCLLAFLTVALLSACGSGSSSTPTAIPNSENIFYAHNLVFRNNTSSTILSTGYNGFGQLGSGDLGSRNVPGGLNAYYPFNGFATGGNHSVAFFNNSTVRTWGYNNVGQLGIGDVATAVTHSTTPIKTVNISGVIAVAAGAHHNLALKNDGTIWAWGGNDAGQLGIGWNLTPVGYSTSPKRVSGSTGSPFANISSIAANGKHSLVRADGRVWAWGLNSSGQLGLDPAGTGVLGDPLAVAGIPLPVSAIAAGGAFSYAVSRTDGSVWAWGGNDNGQLGNGTTASSFTPKQVMKNATTPLTGVVQVAAGIQHGLARLADGTVWAWGYNFFGQLGNNAKLDSPYAVQVVADSTGTPLTGVTDIRAFGSSSMAKIGGAWYVWGDNTYGQLGILPTATINLIPVRMSGF